MLRPTVSITVKLMLVFLWVGPASAQDVDETYYIAVGCMEYQSISDRKWQQLYLDLMKESFKMTRASFKEIATELKIDNLRSKEIEVRSETSEEGNDLRPMTPHKNNFKAITEFHENYEEGGSIHLMRVAKRNRAIVLLFIEAPGEHRFKSFINNPTGELNIAISGFYPTSNIVGYEYVKVTKPMFENWFTMRAALQEGIKSAVKQCVTNTAGIITYESSSAREGGDTVLETIKGW